MNAKVDGKFTTKPDKYIDPNNNDIKEFYDLKDLLELSHYSGARNNLEDIIKSGDFMHKLHKDGVKPAYIDTSLLRDDKIVTFD